MITLLLLHPLKRTPVQVWPFENEPVIRIGRSTDNQVILYSAVVSRHHVELRQVGGGWEVENLGTNGTYLDGKRITKVPVADGAIIRLARSGPNIQIRIGSEALQDLPENLQGDRMMSQRFDAPPTETEINNLPNAKQTKPSEPSESALSDSNGSVGSMGTIPVPSHLRLSADRVAGVASGARATSPSTLDRLVPSLGAPADASSRRLRSSRPLQHGSHYQRDRPLQTLQTIGNYQILQVLGQGDIGVTYLAWHEGKQLVLKTLSSEWLQHPRAQAALEYEAELLRQLYHPQIPQFFDFFLMGGRPYLAMEMIPGENLARRIATTGPVSPARAIDWMLEICNILEYLHCFNPPIPHRNIEPANLIDRSKTVSQETSSHDSTWSDDLNDLALVGFGTAKAVILGQQTPAGSTGYSAPDQLEINASPAVDLYSLGPTFAYLLTGQSPVSFCHDGIQGHQFCAESIPAGSSGITNIIRKLTHSSMEHRYPSISAVVDDLRGVAAQLESVQT
ncbi:MAG TPA: protein kinase domain-containing protein [Elainellaceae cyanobacterium]